MDINSPFLLFFIGLWYIIVMGAIALMRRESLSIRFAVESLLLIALIGGLAFPTGFVLHPAIFLILLYLVTMRVRLMVSLGDAFASQGNFRAAERMYNLAQWLVPDAASRMSIDISRGIVRLQKGELNEATAIFQEALAARGKSNLGIMNEASCQYHLGVAYQRKGQEKEAAQAFNAVLHLWPLSEVARRAAVALARQSHAGEGER